MTHHLADRNALPITLPISLAYDKAMKRIVLIAIALTVICSENGYARDKTDAWSAVGSSDCREFLEGYATAEFIGPSAVRASHAFKRHVAWVNGYISAYNAFVQNGKTEVFEAAKMSRNDTTRWLGAWCRDNMSESLEAAILELLLKIDNKAMQRAFPN